MCPHKKKLRDGKPLCGLDEERDATDSGGDASSSEDEAGTDDDLAGEVDGGFAPPLDIKGDARLDSLRRDNLVLQEIVRRQDEVLEEMEQRTREIQAATAQRREELQALRAARAAREAAAAAAAAEEANALGQETEAEAAHVQDGVLDEEAAFEVVKDAGNDVVKEKMDDEDNKKE